MLKAASEISYDHFSSTSSDRLTSSSHQKRPRSSHLMECSSTADPATQLSPHKHSRNLHETSFESYFGVERSASNSDVVRIRVPYSREDAMQLKKATSQDENKIRISVNHDLNTAENGNSRTRAGSQKSGEEPRNSQRASLEESFNTKLVMKQQNNSHYIKSNSKSMTNL